MPPRVFAPLPLSAILMDLSHPPLLVDGGARLEELPDEHAPFNRKAGSTDPYSVNTIGPAAGASIIRQTPGLGRSANAKTSAGPSSSNPNRSTFGTASDPLGGPDSPLSDNGAFDANEAQAYFDRSVDAQQHVNMPSIASFGLSEQPATRDEEGERFMSELRALEEERRARAYADMSAAEQYALQARLHAQKQADKAANTSRPASVYGGVSPHPPPEPVVQMSEGRAPKNHFSSDAEEGSLGSPFRQRANPNDQRYAPQSQPQSQGQSYNGQRAASAGHSRPHLSQAHRPNSPASHLTRERGRKSSVGSLNASQDNGHGLTKDELLERLAEALRKERAKNKSYMKELIEAENEIDALSRLLDNTRVEAAHVASKHISTISVLRKELDRARLALEQAREVRADDAERFLDLLDTTQFQNPDQNASGMVHAASDGEEAREPYLPVNKTEAILSFSADEPGGTHARTRQRSNERRKRLNEAMSTIASSSLDPNDLHPRKPWPKQQNTVRQPHQPIPLQVVEPTPPCNAFTSVFRRRVHSTSRADVPDDTTSGPYPGKAIARQRSNRRASESDMRTLQGGPQVQGGLLPPTVAQAHQSGTYGRSPSADLPRDASSSTVNLGPMGKKRKERQSSISKIFSKAFPARDPPARRSDLNPMSVSQGLTSFADMY